MAFASAARIDPRAASLWLTTRRSCASARRGSAAGKRSGRASMKPSEASSAVLSTKSCPFSRMCSPSPSWSSGGAGACRATQPAMWPAHASARAEACR
eukprot:scaffold2835_cov105-Isochrysis_galbana.AAC.13